LITSMPAPVKTASKAAGEFGVAVVEQELQPGSALVEVHR